MLVLGLTQDDLRKPLKVKTRGAVGHYLSGRRDPNPEQLIAMAGCLKVSLDELLMGSQHAPGEIDAAKSTASIDESLLALCLQEVERLFNDLLYPKQHPIRSEHSRSHIVAHAYARALQENGHITPDLRQELQEKIRMLARWSS
jgi:transcriptional regulator with XRE-family HTH domain